MKTKVIASLIISAVVTLSFTFISVKESPTNQKSSAHSPSISNSPAGGLVIDEK